VNKKSTIRYEKFIAGLLLTLMVAGSLAALLVVASPYLALLGLKFTDGQPDPETLGNTLLGLSLYASLVAPCVVFVGGVSSITYTLLYKDEQNKIFLRIWGSVLIILALTKLFKSSAL